LAIEVQVTGGTGATTVYPLLAEYLIPDSIFTGVTRLAYGTAAVYQLLTIVEDAVETIGTNEVVIVET
jgi:hypothetical protein